MALKLSVEGNRNKVREFIDFLKTSSQWRFYSGSKMSNGRNELRMDYFFDERPYTKMKPSIITKQLSKLSITSLDGTKIDISLTDAKVTDMGNGTTYIHGKNHDFFSD
jgi:hypothetical protein